MQIAMKEYLTNATVSLFLAGATASLMLLGQFSQGQILSFAIVVTILSYASTRFRCSLFLMVPGILTKTGRILLAVYALELVITGPLTDLLENMDLFLRMCVCFTKLYFKFTIGEFSVGSEPGACCL